MCRIHVVQNAVHLWFLAKTNELSVAVQFGEFIVLLKLHTNYSVLRIYLRK
jgi:hypothetical protein